MSSGLNKLLFFISVLLFFSNCTNIESKTKIVRAFPNLTFSNPVDIQSPKDNTNRIFIVSQKGIIHVFNNNDNELSSSIFLDIQDKVLFGGEQGLLGLAFHPNYKTNGFFYVNYTADNPKRTIVSRFKVSSSNTNQADSESELILLEVNQPYSNHNGGQIAFGPDGFLYISYGDGGSGGDPGNRAQNLSSFLGKIIRIDVNNNENGKNYSIPSDNPFKGNVNNYNEEIYAYGLRNVWRFSFDNSDKLWAADVGQNKWEEINLIENGKNYGWRIMEASHCFNPDIGCNQDGLTLPIWEYGHNSDGGYSITGGFVYYGTNAPQLQNKYVYGDYVSGNIWTYDPSNSTNTLLKNVSANISTFGVDEKNELYFADYSTGQIYKFVDDNVNSVGSVNPNNFKLNQNYPNPFNPSTLITYTIGQSSQKDSFVNLEVFTPLGEKVTTLVNEIQTAGDYSVEFSINYKTQFSIKSGIYFYRIRTNNKMETKKMIALN